LSRYYSHINSAEQFLQQVKKDEPLVHQLKKFFAANKKFGSKDRKNITSLCYSYYRVCNALPNKTIAEKIITGLFLCNTTSNETLATLAPELNNEVIISLEQKCKKLQINLLDLFPFHNHLGKKINKEKFATSILTQPLLFIRARPNEVQNVTQKLLALNIPFENSNTNCFALPNATKIEEHFKVNKEVVIQDKNSQQVLNFLLQEKIKQTKVPDVWDCCAASGGKSILLFDILNGQINLDVSDIRESTLQNLQIRFREAGIKKYYPFVADLLGSNKNLPQRKYDIIICDVPCSGSGTWARTTEQINFFAEKNILSYAIKQKNIARNALSFLQKDGLFFYITCSVFESENEAVVAYLKEKFHVQVLHMEYLKGYETQADTMFVAVLSL
jgi:16S rRNA (cytosine967-C5)-methyltransferase